MKIGTHLLTAPPHNLNVLWNFFWAGSVSSTTSARCDQSPLSPPHLVELQNYRERERGGKKKTKTKTLPKQPRNVSQY